MTANNRFYPLPGELQQDEFLTHLFTPVNSNLALTEYLGKSLQQIAGVYQQNPKTDAFDQLYRESLFKTYTTINRFRTLVEEGDLNVHPETFQIGRAHV